MHSIVTQPVIFCSGKGGVGKSTLSAALAVALARKGRRVLLVETDTYSALDRVFGTTLPDSEIVTTQLGVDLVNLKKEDSLAKTLHRFVPGERIAKIVANNKIASAFFDAAPSVTEFVLLNTIFELADGEDASSKKNKTSYDHVVVDLPASGHAVTFLKVARTLDQIMGGIGPVASRAQEIASRIENPAETAIVAICIPEEMPVTETIELAGHLKEGLKRPISAILVNMVHEAPLPDEFQEALKASFEAVSDGQDPNDLILTQPNHVSRLLAGTQLAVQWHERDLFYLDKLATSINLPIFRFPYTYLSHPPDLLSSLAEQATQHLS